MIFTRKRKKKGQLGNVLTLFIIIFVVGLTIVLGKYILDTFYSAMDDANIMTPTSNQTREVIDASFVNFDYGLVTLTIIMIVGLMVTSFMIPTHPIFLAINVVGIFVLVFLGMVMTNVYGEFVAGEGSDYLGDTASGFPLYNFLMNYIAYIGAIAVAISSIIMFARGQ